MTTSTRSILSRVLVLLLVATVAVAWAQTRVNGTVGPCAQVAPADLVAEARTGLAYFPVEVGRGTVGADGSFALAFHEELSLPPGIALPVGQMFGGATCTNMAISEPEARLVMVRELRIVPRGAACEYCETLGAMYAATQARGSLRATGDLAVHWIHANEPVTITGTCTFGWGTETYDLSLEPGWNTVVLETTEVRGGEGYCDCHDVLVTVAPFPRALVAWHFAPTE